MIAFLRKSFSDQAAIKKRYPVLAGYPYSWYVGEWDTLSAISRYWRTL